MNRNGLTYFTVPGTVTLNQASGTDTTLFLGAQLQPAGGGFIPTPSVIKDLDNKLVIPAGRLSATFSALAQGVGSPYNARFYAFRAQGQQAGGDASSITVPAK